ncbi:MAG: Nif3-like dinuclear metal center hexameric protein [Gemmatimonadetes bacterium]|nr:Nif3-like dinuclear metal center hexameric protein [Gemmatimonadota bacterium]MBT8405752.1 Nif3-like dinuclear metal center hexameric protein [Gemmatimonadota bacterium]NNK63456.1 Nif3-like dinuclear metal center hexameric protein [Gemmatimonadota bacterium]
MAQLESIVAYADELLDVAAFPDYSVALNGLQVEGDGRPIERIVSAVDASEAVIREAVDREADLLIVHHGLFWGGLRPITGRHHRKLRHLVDSGLAVYSVHLPLDGHGEIGNAVLLARAIGVEPEGPFGSYEGRAIGWRAGLEPSVSPDDLASRVCAAVGGPVRVLGSGPEAIRSIGIVTGAGAGFMEEAATQGLHAVITGEAAHHHFADAHELGLHLLLAGHYATETFGVRALGSHLADRFGLTVEFLDHPSGL